MLLDGLIAGVYSRIWIPVDSRVSSQPHRYAASRKDRLLVIDKVLSSDDILFRQVAEEMNFLGPNIVIHPLVTEPI